MLKKLTILLFIFLLTGSVIYFAYFYDKSETEKPAETQAEAEEPAEEDFFINDWKEISKDFFIKEYPVHNADQELIDKVTVVKINPNEYTFFIHQDTENVKKVSEWRSELNDILVINGGYFNDDYSPSGGIIINKEMFGTLTHSGANGYTGMIAIKNDSVDINYLPDSNYAEEHDLDYALQSFPMIIKPGGQPGIEEDSKKQAQRSIIAKDKDGNILFINTLNSTFSLYEIMQFMLDSDLNIDAALNLDGGPSSGISIETDDFKYLIESVAVPNVITVEKSKSQKVEMSN